MTNTIFTHTSTGLPVIAHHFSNGGPRVLILGGVHGDEAEGVVASLGLIDRFTQSFNLKLDLLIIPAFNADGVLAKTRANANGVDLNRNLPTKDWSPEIKGPRYVPGPAANSELESQALCSYLKNTPPKMIFSLHSWHPVLNVNGDCLPEAEVLKKWTGYNIDTDIGYPTPGCLGTYAGLERAIPTLTYEIQRGQSTSDILKIHVPAIAEALKVTEARFA